MSKVNSLFKTPKMQFFKNPLAMVLTRTKPRQKWQAAQMMMEEQIVLKATKAFKGM